MLYLRLSSAPVFRRFHSSVSTLFWDSQDSACAGPCEELELAIAQSIPLVMPELNRSRWSGWPPIVAILLIGCIVLAWLQIGLRPPLLYGDLHEIEDRMTKLLERWQFNNKLKNGDKIATLNLAQRFLKQLSQDGLGAEFKGNHPDVRFFLRLPEKEISLQNKAHLQGALQDLLVCLKDVKKPGMLEQQPSRSLISTLDEIEHEMNYRRWWGKSGKLLKYASSEKADAKVGEYARRFISDSTTDRANSGWQRPAAEAMLTELQKWKVEAVRLEDVSHRLFLIFHCYSELLSQYDF